MELLDLFHRGGPVMYPIFLCSLTALTVFLERLWSLRRNRIIPKKLQTVLQEHVQQGRIQEALALCDSNPGSPLARVARAGLAQYGEQPDMIRFMVAEVGAQEASGLERYQRVLSTVAYLSPLLGLLGTVSGMIKAFDMISRHSVGDPAMLAAGISEALITTFAGLTVAIPAVIMDRFVQSRSSRLSLELEKETVALTEMLVKGAECRLKPKRTSPVVALRGDASGQVMSDKPLRSDHVDAQEKI